MSTPSKPPAPPPNLPRCLSIRQLQEHTGICRNLISRALNDGSLEHYRIGSRAIIPEAAALAWLESHRVGKLPHFRSNRQASRP